jgi:hypothetical protein
MKRVAPMWELHVTLDRESDQAVEKSVGRAHIFYDTSPRRLIYVLPDKKSAQNAKRRVKAKLKAKVSCDIVPHTTAFAGSKP